MNKLYKNLLKQILAEGTQVSGRNGGYLSCIGLPQLCFTKCPTITVLRPAYKLAALELWWMLQPEDTPVPQPVAHWWVKQLNVDSRYINGYGYQLRQSTYRRPDKTYGHFDQIKYVQQTAVENPGSRHILLSCWNTGEMATITQANQCIGSPACCHDTATQFFVRNGTLWMKTYQRSCDMRLGFIHNVYQSWMLLSWMAHCCNYSVGGVYYVLGDAHIYTDSTHMSAVQQIIDIPDSVLDSMPEPKFSYTPSGKEFIATDFSVTDIPEPLVTTKSKLM